MNWLFSGVRPAFGIFFSLLTFGMQSAGLAQAGIPSAELPTAISYCDYCLASQGISPLEVGSSGVRADIHYLSLGSLYQDGSEDYRIMAGVQFLMH